MATTTLTLPSESDSIVLKTDRLGRVQTPPELRERILDAFETSGMTGAAFAAHCGIGYTTFANWRQKRRRAREAQRLELSEPPQFAELCLTTPRPPAEASPKPSPASETLTLQLPGGAKTHLHTSAQTQLAATLLQALAETNPSSESPSC